MNASYLPAPLEWHPAYLDWDRTALIYWLNDRNSHYYRMPIPCGPRPIFAKTENTPFQDLDMRTLELVKHKAYGWAPYVGDPFIHMWFTAVDQFGRWIAGESWIEYLPEGYR